MEQSIMLQHSCNRWTFFHCVKCQVVDFFLDWFLLQFTERRKAWRKLEQKLFNHGIKINYSFHHRPLKLAATVSSHVNNEPTQSQLSFHSSSLSINPSSVPNCSWQARMFRQKNSSRTSLSALRCVKWTFSGVGAGKKMENSSSQQFNLLFLNQSKT